MARFEFKFKIKGKSLVIGNLSIFLAFSDVFLPLDSSMEFYFQIITGNWKFNIN